MIVIFINADVYCGTSVSQIFNTLHISDVIARYTDRTTSAVHSTQDYTGSYRCTTSTETVDNTFEIALVDSIKYLELSKCFFID